MTLTISDCIAEIKKTNSDIKVDNIKVFEDGWDYIVCVLEGKKAYRFPRMDDYTKTLPNEVAFLELFSTQSPIQVPKLTLHHLSNGKPFVIYPFISGVQFKRDISETFSESEIFQVARQLGEFLTKLHSFPLDKAKALGMTELNSFDSWDKRFVKIKREVYPHISENEQEWVNQIFTNYLELVKKNPPKNKLTHSDIMPEHIIVEPETRKLNGIIDFGDMMIADPAYDFTVLKKYGQKFLEIVYENYKLEMDENFEQRMQFYEDRLVVTNLEHSLEQDDKEKIELHKKQFTDYRVSK